MYLFSTRNCKVLCQVLVLGLLIQECKSRLAGAGCRLASACKDRGAHIVTQVGYSKPAQDLAEFYGRNSRRAKTAIKNKVIQAFTDQCVLDIDDREESMSKYIYLRKMQIEQENEFYKCLVRNVDKMLPIVYTPVVGKACKNYNQVVTEAGELGLTLNIVDHKGKIAKRLLKWKRKQEDVRAIVVTDGERILGLGDLGANGMGIPVGKLALYSALGGVHPRHCLPVTLDVGTNNEKYLDDPKDKYVGIKIKRVTGDEYYNFIDEFIEAVVAVFGRNTLIQFEDFANPTAYPLLEKYRYKYTVFNDDIQGTAAVTVAGILAAAKFRKTEIEDARVLFVGAGSAATGIGTLLVEAMKGKPEDNRKKIYMKDWKALLSEEYCEFEKDDPRRNFCHKIDKDKNKEDLDEIILWLKPNILIGVSGVRGLFTKRVLRNMAEVNKDKPSPIIMPLSNPTSKSECTADDAYNFAKGCLFASGSPFSPVYVDEKTLENEERGKRNWFNKAGNYKTKFQPMQCNNDNIFPGVALGIILAKMKTVPNKVFLIAAQTLAEKCVRKSDFAMGSLYPQLDDLRMCSVMVAAAVIEYAFNQKDLSDLDPKPKGWKKWDFNQYKVFVKQNQYNPEKTGD